MSERVYLIHKSGRGWYRPDSAGYTPFKHDAGRYTEDEAKAITHPNGEDGPRDGMLYRHQDLVRDNPSDRIEALEANLEKAMEALRNIAVVGFSEDTAVSAAIAKQTVSQARATLAKIKGESKDET